MVIVIPASKVMSMLHRGEQQTYHSANAAQQYRFDQKLKQYLVARCAERFSQADFERPLSDRNQHDVHHHDAADNQRNQRDWNDDPGDSGGELVDLISESCVLTTPNVSSSLPINLRLFRSVDRASSIAVMNASRSRAFPCT